MLWGKGAAERLAIQFTSLTAGRTRDEFLYTLRTDHLCAICSVRGEAAEEQRFWNHHSKRVAHLNTHPTLRHIACSSETANGSAHISVWMANDGTFGDVTEGDSYDTAPSWAPGEKLVLVFRRRSGRWRRFGSRGGVKDDREDLAEFGRGGYAFQFLLLRDLSARAARAERRAPPGR